MTLKPSWYHGDLFNVSTFMNLYEEFMNIERKMNSNRNTLFDKAGTFRVLLQIEYFILLQ
jgi:hypothetical protein